MNLIDYCLLEAEVSFCVYKNSCHVVWKCIHVPFWLQLVKWSCHLFPPFWSFCFSFPTHSSTLVSLPFWPSTRVCLRTSGDKCPLKFFSHKFDSSTRYNRVVKWTSLRSPNTRLFHSVYSQTHSLEARLWGKYHGKFLIFKKNKKSALACKGSKFMVSLHTSYMAANVGPKTQ